MTAQPSTPLPSHQAHQAHQALNQAAQSLLPAKHPAHRSPLLSLAAWGLQGLTLPSRMEGNRYELESQMLEMQAWPPENAERLLLPRDLDPKEEAALAAGMLRLGTQGAAEMLLENLHDFLAEKLNLP